MKRKPKVGYQKAPDHDQLKKLTPDELKTILEAHQLWLASDGKEGVRANFQGLNLCHENLSEANLEQALMGGSNLEGATLYKTKLMRSDLAQTNFHNADLRYADFTEAKNLQLEQLSGANLSNSVLPGSLIKYDGLKNIEDASKNAKHVFFLMVFLCVYSWLTMGSTTQADLITDYPTSRLPIISIPIHISSFFMWAPAILLCIYFYYQLNMQRLWERLSAMPAFFPDGESLDKKVYPWLLTGLVRAYFHNLQTNKKLPFFKLQKILSILFGWFIVPFTLYLFWGNYLITHEVIGTAWLLFLFSVSVAFSFSFYFSTRWTLMRAKRISISSGWIVIIVILIFAFLSPISIGIIYGLPPYYFAKDLGDNDIRILVPRILEARIGRHQYQLFHTGGVLVESDISIKPPNWTGQNVQELDYVKGAHLNSANLRNALAMRCFLIKADLRMADMQGARFQQADLRKANLEMANLTRTDLYDADLRWANFSSSTLVETHLSNAKLTDAKLDRANLRRAELISADLQNSSIQFANLRDGDLSRANLKGANLYASSLKDANLGFYASTLIGANLGTETPIKGAKLTGANLEGANLNAVNLQGADLIWVQGLTKNQVRKAWNFVLAYYDETMIKELGLPKNHNEMIRSKNLRGANLRRANLYGADLSGFDLENVDLRDAFLGSLFLWPPRLTQTTLQGANLKNSDLRKADFQKSNLRNANFEGAKLNGAKLQGADLTGAIGLTKKQIDSAVIDEETKLP
jgi:uncharacterized protein YjbI with pentapeptide repeats